MAQIGGARYEAASVTPGRALLYASAIGAMGLGVRSAAKGPVPAPVVVGAFVGFSSVVMAGVLEPRLAMFADIWNDAEPDPARPRIAITFDDGPGGATPRIADLLDEAEVKATFFVIGRKLEAQGAVVRRLHERGHVIGCHSFAHDRLFALRSEARVRADLKQALAAIEDAVGAPTTLFRPPIGHTNPTIARVAEELGLSMIGFSIRAYDGTAGARAERVAARVSDALTDGAIVLMHDGAEHDDRDPVAPAALPVILGAMKAKGLVGVTVPRLLDLACPPTASGSSSAA